MLDFLKVPFLVLHFSYYVLMMLLIKLSVILLRMLRMLLSTLSVITHRICRVRWSRTQLVDFNAGKTQLVLSEQSNKTGAIDVKMGVSGLEEKASWCYDWHSLLSCCCFLFFFNGIHSMPGWTATTRHGVTRKRSTKRLKHTGNLFRKNLQLKDVCWF